MSRRVRMCMPLALGAAIGIVVGLVVTKPASAACAKKECDIWNGWCISSLNNLSCDSSGGYCIGSQPCRPY